MNKKITFYIAFALAFTAGVQAMENNNSPLNNWYSTGKQFLQSKWSSLKAGALQIMAAGQSQLGSLAQKAWSYSPMEQRKKSFEDKIDGIKNQTLQYKALDEANEIHKKKFVRLLDKVQRKEARINQIQKNLVKAKEPIVSDEESEDDNQSGSLVINDDVLDSESAEHIKKIVIKRDESSSDQDNSSQEALVSDNDDASPEVAQGGSNRLLSHRESWYKRLSYWNTLSLRSATHVQESTDKFLTNLYSPEQVKMLIDYLAETAKLSAEIYQIIPSYGLLVTIPHEAFDTESGKHIAGEELLKYRTRYDYQGNQVSEGKSIDTNDIQTIVGLTAKGKPYKNNDEFLMYNQGQGYALKQAYEAAKKENRSAEEIKAAKNRYQEYKNNIKRFNLSQYDVYSDQTGFKTVLTDYARMRQKIREENKKFREGGKIVDSATGEEKDYSGWIAILKAEQEKLIQQKEASAKRHYLW